MLAEMKDSAMWQLFPAPATPKNWRKQGSSYSKTEISTTESLRKETFLVNADKSKTEDG